eukprot:Hpha_TRINITY_DN14973_c1_g10::TRINITY_DN14973_c1_g10_i1::g.144680::m.144680/K01279/TPP1, CLN2; tripeptidyl-peptidase I
MWSLLLGAVVGGLQHEVTLWVKHQEGNIKKLEETFHAVSDPQSARYGQHLSFEEVVELQRPLDSHVRAVRQWIDSVGGQEIKASVAGDKIVAHIPQEVLLASTEVSSALDMVSSSALVDKAMSKPRREHRKPQLQADPQKCLATRAVPPCIRTAYGLGNTTAVSKDNSQAVIVNQNYKQSDLNRFCSQYNLNACPKTVTNVGTNSGSAGDEASLDVQYITATGQGVPLTWVYIDGHTANPFASWVTWASNTSVVPWVHSLSVGEPEDEFQSDNGGPAAVLRMNQELMALGTRGVSILFASGDSGYQKAQKYGSSSPYVTSVGGVFNGELGYDVLQVDYVTTGGFSSLDANPIQKWQTDAVASWMKTKGSRPSGFNSSRRCAPDLSIYDAGFYVVQNGEDSPLGGTSCAAPTLAGMISLINDARLQAGKPTLGFLNYFLYQNSAAFLDITVGNNNGYAATTGYDPASGLGTFAVDTFNKLLAAAKQAV